MKEVIKVEDCVSNIGDYDIPIHNAIIIPEDATNGGTIQESSGRMKTKVYAVYVKNGKYWRADKSLHTLRSAKEMVKGLKVNGEKAFFSKVRCNNDSN